MLLANQDRSLFDIKQIAEGRGVLHRALNLPGHGFEQIHDDAERRLLERRLTELERPRGLLSDAWVVSDLKLCHAF